MSAPRPYIRPFPVNWWLRRGSYRRYMLRELTSALIGAWALVMVVGFVRLSEGDAAWNGFVHALMTPSGVLFQIAVLIAAVYHSVTWFGLAPRTMPLWIGGKRVPAAWIAIAHYVAWIVISLIVLLAVGG